MSCTPWSNEKERADYYENLYKEQFAEIERLNGIRADLSKEIEGLRTATEEAVGCYNRMESLYHIKCMELKVSKSEAIKEFAERLKEKLQLNRVVIGYNGAFVETVQLDNLVKEMTGENNGN